MLEPKQIISYSGVKTLMYLILKITFTLLLVSCIGSGLNAQSLRYNKSVSDSTPAGKPFNLLLDSVYQSTTSTCENVYHTDFISDSLDLIIFSDPITSGVSTTNHNIGATEAVILFDNKLINESSSTQRGSGQYVSHNNKNSAYEVLSLGEVSMYGEVDCVSIFIPEPITNLRLSSSSLTKYSRNAL